MEKKKKTAKPPKENMSTDWDFSEGFGGIPDDVDMTKNIGCASGPKPKKDKKE